MYAFALQCIAKDQCFTILITNKEEDNDDEKKTETFSKIDNGTTTIQSRFYICDVDISVIVLISFDRFFKSL